MKLQEAPENIPTGEMPRSVLVTVDRYLADTCTPGTRVKIMGIFKNDNKNMNRVVPVVSNGSSSPDDEGDDAYDPARRY